MTIRLGAVGYLNARPLVYGLDAVPRFSVRYDVPSECARLLHEGTIDVGLIPSIEFLRGGPFRIAPDLAIASRGTVASVAIYTTRPIREVRSIALDTSSRTSVALVSVLCARLFKIQPVLERRGPDLRDMLAHSDAALIIGDNALFLDYKSAISNRQSAIEKVDLGDAWTTLTGLPFVWAFWAGRPGALSAGAVDALLAARDAGVAAVDAIATAYCGPLRAARGRAYLRDNIRYTLGEREELALSSFYELAGRHEIVDAGRGFQVLTF